MKSRFLEIEFIETLFPHPFFSLMTRDVKEKEKEKREKEKKEKRKKKKEKRKKKKERKKTDIPHFLFLDLSKEGERKKRRKTNLWRRTLDKSSPFVETRKEKGKKK